MVSVSDEKRPVNKIKSQTKQPEIKNHLKSIESRKGGTKEAVLFFAASNKKTNMPTRPIKALLHI